MKSTPILLALLSAATLTLGCKPAAESSKVESRDTAAQLDNAKKETKEAAQDMKDYAYGQKSEFVDKMQTQLAAIKRDLDQISAQLEKSSDSAKAEAKPKLQVLRDQVAKLNKQVESAKNATESTWDDVKAGFKKGFGELNEGFQQARQWVSDKVAP